MKRFALTLVAAAAALFVGTDAASAQNFSWGPKVGFNVSSMSNTEMNAKVGLTAGVFGEIRIGQWIDLQAELLYSRQGVTDKYTEEGIKVKDRLKSHYLNIPVLANFYVTENLALKTGVQAGFCLGARAIRGLFPDEPSGPSGEDAVSLPLYRLCSPSGLSHLDSME